MPQRRLIPTIVLGLLAALAVYVFLLRGPDAADAFHGTLLDPPVPAEDFTLSSIRGPVTLEDLRGRIAVLFFGYTSCPDDCPLTLDHLARTLEALGDASSRVRVVMITVDPERDSPAEMQRYVSSFHPDFLGLSGGPRVLQEVAEAYGIYHEPASASATGAGEERRMEHSTTATVVGPEGRIRLLWPFGLTPEEMAGDLRELLAGSGAGAGGGGPSGPRLSLEDPWARPMALPEEGPGGERAFEVNSAAYMRIRNDGDGGDVLLAASTPAARAVELHRTRMEDGVMRMRQVDSISLPGGRVTSLEPGGLHMMLLGLTRSLAAEDTILFRLDFRHQGRVELRVPVSVAGGER
jgi:protein SCO1/2